MSAYSKRVIGVFLATVLIALITYGSIINTSDYVTIGNQKWMRKNLEVSTFRNGDSIPQASTNEEWEAFGKQKKPAWCYYKFDLANGKLFGKLYNSYVVSDSRGIAPEGWHVPSYEESMTLINNVGGEETAGISLMSEDYLHSSLKEKNNSGFNALPGGYRGTNFDQIGMQMLCWTSTTTKLRNDQFYVFIIDRKGGAYLLFTTPTAGVSIRCIKD
jgi:Fibrobacter succinogenes major domain (Fib_succ_major).